MKSVHWIRGMASALLCPLYGLFVDRFAINLSTVSYLEFFKIWP